MTTAELRYLIEPHLEGILSNVGAGEALVCHEGTNHCGCTELNLDVDDIVFLREMEEGRIELHPSHRACAEAEWGAAHLIPTKRFSPSPTHAAWSRE